VLLTKKYGCANITFTHDPFSVITSSNKVRFHCMLRCGPGGEDMQQQSWLHTLSMNCS
jgi:hypothetical protein